MLHEINATMKFLKYKKNSTSNSKILVKTPLFVKKVIFATEHCTLMGSLN